MFKGMIKLNNEVDTAPLNSKQDILLDNPTQAKYASIFFPDNFVFPPSKYLCCICYAMDPSYVRRDDSISKKSLRSYPQKSSGLSVGIDVSFRLICF
jgi:hypothetical protein